MSWITKRKTPSNTKLPVFEGWSHSSILMCYDSQVTSFQHTDVLLILRLPHSSILMCYWFSGYLIPAYWCVIDSQVNSFQHTDVLLILRWPHSSILMCYWFSCDLILAYWSIINSQVTWESITHQYAGMRSPEN